MSLFEVVKKLILPVFLALVIAILAWMVNDYEKREVGTLTSEGEVAGEEAPSFTPP
jgi:hypothetical protein